MNALEIILSNCIKVAFLVTECFCISPKFFLSSGIRPIPFFIAASGDFTKTFSDLISEAIDTMGDEDWILTADLFEYELVPAIKTLDDIINKLSAETSQGNVQ